MLFDIRQWRASRGLPERINNPDVIRDVTALLRRDLTERLAASGESRQQSQDQTGLRNAGERQGSGVRPA
jgi:hypothetical protein